MATPWWRHFFSSVVLSFFLSFFFFLGGHLFCISLREGAGVLATPGDVPRECSSGMFFGNVLRECSSGMVFGDSPAVAWQETPASDTPGHPPEPQAQTMLVMSYMALHGVTLPRCAHWHPPPRDPSMAGKVFRCWRALANSARRVRICDQTHSLRVVRIGCAGSHVAKATEVLCVVRGTPSARS